MGTSNKGGKLISNTPGSGDAKWKGDKISFIKTTTPIVPKKSGGSFYGITLKF
jgi:hypothetical protein